MIQFVRIVECCHGYYSDPHSSEVPSYLRRYLLRNLLALGYFNVITQIKHYWPYLNVITQINKWHNRIK